MSYLRRKLFRRNVSKTLFSIIQTLVLAVVLLQMKSRLFDNGQIEERSRFPYAKSLNCAHGKCLHFKGLLHVCIMFDTDARASLAVTDGDRSISTIGECPSCIPVSYTCCVVMSYSRLKQVHSLNSTRANCETSIEHNALSHSLCAKMR